jgi:hypothetical protein
VLASANGTGTGSFTYVTAPLDSLKLRALQVAVTPIVAQFSGQTITGAIDGAIADAFGSGNGNPVAAGPNGITINFAAEPQSEADKRRDEAFAALGYAGKSAPRSRLIQEREWSLWADVRGSGWDRGNTNADLKGQQVNVTAGIGRKLTPDFLIGLVAGYENFRYESVSIGGTMRGNGGTLGTYAAWRLAPHLRWDAAIAWSTIGYEGTAGTASGSFTGSRWLASTGLTGNYRIESFTLEPSVKVYALRENEREWTDSLGTVQAARIFSTGKVATGGRVIYLWLTSNDIMVSPFIGLYGDWRFGNDNAIPTGQPAIGIGNGWSGRFTSGVSATGKRGGTITLSGDYGGLGTDYKIWTGSVRALWPF